MPLHQMSDFEKRCAARHAERLHLIAHSHYAAIVITQHHHRMTLQLGMTDALATHEKVITVD